jgi:hypothetical protein
VLHTGGLASSSWRLGPSHFFAGFFLGCCRMLSSISGLTRCQKYLLWPQNGPPWRAQSPLLVPQRLQAHCVEPTQYLSVPTTLLHILSPHPDSWSQELQRQGPGICFTLRSWHAPWQPPACSVNREGQCRKNVFGDRNVSGTVPEVYSPRTGASAGGFETRLPHLYLHNLGQTS